jgi:hypothetical protein
MVARPRRCPKREPAGKSGGGAGAGALEQLVDLGTAGSHDPAVNLTPASQRALENLRDPSHLDWILVPLLATAIYCYCVEIERRNWSLVFAGLAFWGMDWLNEIANGLVLHFSGRSALWTTPGKTSYLILVGLNAEICFMFSIAGIALAKMLPADRTMRVLGIPNRLVFALANSVFCVAVEVVLNRAGLLVWEYRFWSFPHVWLIVVFGYLHFNLVAFWVHDMPSVRQKAAAVGVIYALAIPSFVVLGPVLRWI